MTTTPQPKPDDLLPLTPAVLHILLALADGEKHGYAIMQEVVQLSSGAIKMGPGTLYGSIKRMLESGLIRATEERPDPALDDERRRYYELTGFGSRVLNAELNRMEALLKAARAKRLANGGLA